MILYCFKTVKITNQSFHIIMSIIELLFILSIIPVIFLKLYYLFIFIFPIFIITGHIINKYTKYDFLEYICFNENSISMGNIVYDYSYIEKIIINVGSVKGDIESLPIQGLFFPPIISKGVDNVIKITYKGVKKKYNILCETNIDYINLKKTFLVLKEKGLHIKLNTSSFWIR